MSCTPPEERAYTADLDEKFDSEVLSDCVQDVTSEHGSCKNLIDRMTTVLGSWGLETNGIAPVPPENRTDTRLYQLFFIWFSANANILTLTAGTVGPAFYGLGIRESFLMIIVVDVMWVSPL